MRRIQKGLRLAIEGCRDSTHDMRMCCVLIGRSRIRRGLNQNKTHPKSLSRYGKIHAELDAVLYGNGGTIGMDAYVARLTKPGDVAMAKPCESCMTMLRHAGIKNVYWTEGPNTWKTLRLN